MKQYALYIRTTTKEAAKAAEQETLLKKYVRTACPKSSRATFKIYQDEGFSGRTLERPSLKALMQDIQTNTIDSVLISSLSRLSICSNELLNLIEWFKNNNTRLVSLTDNFISNSPREIHIFQVVENLEEQRPDFLEEEKQLSIKKQQSSIIYKFLKIIKNLTEPCQRTKQY